MMKYSSIKKAIATAVVLVIYTLGFIAVGMIESSGTDASEFSILAEIAGIERQTEP